VLVALLLVRFIVPLAGMASDVVYRGFMQEQYAAGQQGIEQASQAIGALAPDGGAADKQWWQLDKHIKQLGDTIDKTVEHAIRLIVVFLLQTLILPARRVLDPPAQRAHARSAGSGGLAGREQRDRGKSVAAGRRWVLG